MCSFLHHTSSNLSHTYTPCSYYSQICLFVPRSLIDFEDKITTTTNVMDEAASLSAFKSICKELLACAIQAFPGLGKEMSLVPIVSSIFKDETDVVHEFWSSSHVRPHALHLSHGSWGITESLQSFNSQD